MADNGDSFNMQQQSLGRINCINTLPEQFKRISKRIIGIDSMYNIFFEELHGSEREMKLTNN